MPGCQKCKEETMELFEIAKHGGTKVVCKRCRDKLTLWPVTRGSIVKKKPPINKHEI